MYFTYLVVTIVDFGESVGVRSVRPLTGDTRLS